VRAVEQGDEADKVRVGKAAAALAAYPRCSAAEIARGAKVNCGHKHGPDLQAPD
jgi:hypothetical protein